MGGYCLYAKETCKNSFALKEGDIFACVADAGWITGHSYIVYGPLLNGVTSFMFESTPMYPDEGRYWDCVERHKINVFYTAPTAIRSLMRFGDKAPNRYDLSSLRVLGTVGEPINPEAWRWYYEVVGKEKVRAGGAKRRLLISNFLRTSFPRPITLTTFYSSLLASVLRR